MKLTEDMENEKETSGINNVALYTKENGTIVQKIHNTEEVRIPVITEAVKYCDVCKKDSNFLVDGKEFKVRCLECGVFYR